MLFVLDVGNTNTVLGVFARAKELAGDAAAAPRYEHLVANWRVATRQGSTVDEYGVLFRNLFSMASLEASEINGIVISSVVPPLDPVLRQVCERYFNSKPLLIEPGIKVLEWLHQWDPSASTEEIRGILGQMLFPRDDAEKRTDVLSGGEAARLLFCKLMLQKPNVLVLDEPTNHLDLESINALNISLQRYQRTVLLVTHDEDLIDEVATRIWHFEGSHEITDFKGAYAEYQAVLA